MRMPLRHPHPGSRVLPKTDHPHRDEKHKKTGKAVGGVSRDRSAEDEMMKRSQATVGC